MNLPAYEPPNAQRASLAAGTAPLFVLLIFTLIVTRLIDAETGFAAFVACTVWLVHEMHEYQKTIDGYNEEYVSRHLSWRTSETIESMLSTEPARSPTREFVQRFLRAGRVVERDGPTL